MPIAECLRHTGRIYRRASAPGSDATLRGVARPDTAIAMEIQSVWHCISGAPSARRQNVSHHPAGVPILSGASRWRRSASHSFAIILRPLTPSDRADISHTIGAIITSGWIKVDRSSTSDMGITCVLAGSEARAFTVMPVPAILFAQMTVGASKCRLGGPVGRNTHSSLLCRSWSQYSLSGPSPALPDAALRPSP